MLKIITSLAVLAMLALPGVTTAMAQGNAGVDEYSENIPGGGGNSPNDNDGGGSPGDPTGTGPLSPEQIEALEAQGEDGAAAAEIAQSTAPDREGGGDAGDGASDDGAAAGDESDDSGIADVIGNVAGGSDSGMGAALPIVLGVVLLGAIAFLVIMRRRSGRAGRA